MEDSDIVGAIVDLAEQYKNEFDLLEHADDFGEAVYDTLMAHTGVDFKGLADETAEMA